MTADTKTSSGVNRTTSTAPRTVDATGKPTIKMGNAGRALMALNDLAASYRELMDLEKDLRQQGIDHLKAFTDQAWEKAYEAAKDSRNALFMQGASSIAGGLLSGVNAYANAKTSVQAKQDQLDAAAEKDFLKGLKSDLSRDALTLSASNGNRALAGGIPPDQINANTQEAIGMLRENRFQDLQRAKVRGGNPITDEQISDAAKLIRAGAGQGNNPINHLQLIQRVDDGIARCTSEGLEASNKIAQQDALNKNMVDLGKGFVDTGFQVGQALYTQKSRQEDADAAKISQSQKMADQYQSELEAERQGTVRDLRSISEQIGRIVPQRG